jgi:hypothetical protein
MFNAVQRNGSTVVALFLCKVCRITSRKAFLELARTFDDAIASVWIFGQAQGLASRVSQE